MPEGRLVEAKPPALEPDGANSENTAGEAFRARASDAGTTGAGTTSATTQGASTAKFRVRIEGAIEDVWHEITRTDAPIASFFNSRMHLGAAGLRPGSRLAMRSPDGKYTGVVGEILEVDPPRRFAHTFRFTNYDDPECAVVYDLEESAEGVLFTLTIRDLPIGTKTAKQMAQGGKMIVGTLKAVVETGRPALGTRLLFVLFRVLGPLTPRRSLSSRWPLE